MLPRLRKTLPPGVTITPLNDQFSVSWMDSVFDVGAEVVGRRARLADLAVLLFVGSWRSAPSSSPLPSRSRS